MNEKTSETKNMKIVVLGGTGLIGSKVVNLLRARGHEVVAASPSQGINSITGEGLTEALTGAQVVMDVTNSPSFEDKAVLEFFETSTRNVLAAEAKTGVDHHVAVSIVGSERLPASGYLRAKVAQEKLIKASPIPYTIVRATQFFEFVGRIADEATSGQTVHLPSVLFQPIFSDDLAANLAKIAVAKPLNGTIELAGPDAIPFDEVVRQYLVAHHDPRTVLRDEQHTTLAQRLRSGASSRVRTRCLVPPVSRTGLTAPLRRAKPLLKHAKINNHIPKGHHRRNQFEL
jgi:uncharacterized protein YbjT (DUF2867 family)